MRWGSYANRWSNNIGQEQHYMDTRADTHHNETYDNHSAFECLWSWYPSLQSNSNVNDIVHSPYSPCRSESHFETDQWASILTTRKMGSKRHDSSRKVVMSLERHKHSCSNRCLKDAMSKAWKDWLRLTYMFYQMANVINRQQNNCLKLS